jgi:outer membrane immunogenic protein
MKKLLLAGVAAAGLVAGANAASAADLPARQAPPAPFVAAIPVFTWTGFYIGAQVGYAWGDDENNFPSNALVFNGVTYEPFDSGFGGDNDSFLAGVHAGYNYQFGSIVVGIEGDVEGLFGDDEDDDFTGVVFNANTGLPATFAFNSGTLDWQGSIRGRVGFAFDRAMIYATGGFAFGGVSGGFASTGFGNDGDDTITGWTLGAGVEYAFTNNLTTRLEYRYTSFEGDDSVFDGVTFGGDELDFHAIRVGLSYKF